MNIQLYLESAMKQGRSDEEIRQTLSQIRIDYSEADLEQARDRLQEKVKSKAIQPQEYEDIKALYEMPAIVYGDSEAELKSIQDDLGKTSVYLASIVRQKTEAYLMGSGELPKDDIRLLSQVLKMADAYLGYSKMSDLNLMSKMIQSYGGFPNRQAMIDADSPQ